MQKFNKMLRLKNGLKKFMLSAGRRQIKYNKIYPKNSINFTASNDCKMV